MNTGEHLNATAYRRTVDAFRAGDFDAIRSLVAEDVVWHVPGRHSMAGEIHGLDELVGWLGRASEFGFTIRELYGCPATRGGSRDPSDERVPFPRWAAGRAVDVPRGHGRLGRHLQRLTSAR